MPDKWDPFVASYAMLKLLKEEDREAPALLADDVIQRWIDKAKSKVPGEMGMTEEGLAWANIIALGNNLLEAKRRLAAISVPPSQPNDRMH